MVTIIEHITNKEIFSLSDPPTWEEAEALKFHRLEGHDHAGILCNRIEDGDWIQAVYAKEKRQPKADEWFLYGNPVSAYKATHDMKDEYFIAKLVRVRRVTVITVVSTG
jgi:hypothetical protein